MKELIERLELTESISSGDLLKVTKTGLKGRFSVEKRIPKGKFLKVISTNGGPNRNQMTVVREDKPGDRFTISQDWDLDKVRKQGK